MSQRVCLFAHHYSLCDQRGDSLAPIVLKTLLDGGIETRSYDCIFSLLVQPKGNTYTPRQSGRAMSEIKAAFRPCNTINMRYYDQ